MDRGGGAPNGRKKARMEALVAIITGRFMQVREAATRDLQQRGGRTEGRKEVCRESSASQGGEEGRSCSPSLPSGGGEEREEGGLRAEP